MAAVLKSFSDKAAFGEPPERGLAPRQESSADKVFRAIVRGLYDGQYVPGQRLVETDLTHRFGVSRGSVREALNRLTAEGIVELKLHRGAQIRQLTREEAFEIMDLLEVLIGLSARLAAGRIDLRGHRGLLQACVTALADHEQGSTFFEFVRARNAFYRALLKISGSGELKRVLTSVQVNLVRIHARTSEVESGRGKHRLNEYRAIADAVLAGDGRGAEAAARRHVRHVRNLLSRLPRQSYPASDLD